MRVETPATGFLPTSLGSIEIDGERLHFRSKYNRNLIEQIKRLGMSIKRNKDGKFLYWHAKTSKMFLNKFVETFPEFGPQFPGVGYPKPDYSSYAVSSYLLKHQLKASKIGVNHPRFAYFHGIGSGKTLVGLEMIKQKRVRTLVLCPLSVIEDAWLGDRGDIQKFAPEIEAVNLWALKQKSKSASGFRAYREGLYESPVVIINYESFLTIKDDLLQAGFQMLIIDESARLKDGRRKTTKAVLEFADEMDYCYPLSGLPAPNSELEYFNQVNCIDPMLFGRSFTLFKDEFFYTYGYGGFKWAMKQEKRQEFLEKLATIADFVRPEDVMDLPEPVHSIRRIHLDIKEREAYRAMARELYIKLGDKEIVAGNAAIKLMKLREGTSGFYYYLEEEDGKKEPTRKEILVGTSKLNELSMLLPELGGYQAIIWTHFLPEAERIQTLMVDQGYSWSRVDGTVAKSDRPEIIHRFQDGLTQFLIAHPKSIGHGNRLENCQYAIYFSLSESYEQYDQSMRRILRRGQENQCKFFYLIADHTVDEKILETLERKGNVAEAVVDYIRENHGER